MWSELAGHATRFGVFVPAITASFIVAEEPLRYVAAGPINLHRLHRIAGQNETICFVIAELGSIAYYVVRTFL